MNREEFVPKAGKVYRILSAADPSFCLSRTPDSRLVLSKAKNTVGEKFRVDWGGGHLRFVSALDGRDVRVPEFADGMVGTAVTVEQCCGSDREHWTTEANEWGHCIAGYNGKLIGLSSAPAESAELSLQTAKRAENAFVFEELEE